MAPRSRFDKDYYQVLGVSADAGDEEIRKAYRRLALQWHPDRNAGDARATERFKEISEAYGVLIDGQKRREYDAARRVGASAEFRHTREDVFRDLFANPQASAIFEELARELSRMGVRADSHYFRQTLFGGRTVITGGVFVITPLRVIPLVARLVRAALAVRGAAEGAPSRRIRDQGPSSAPPRPHSTPLAPAGGRVLQRVARVARAVLGLAASGSEGIASRGPLDVTLPLRLTPAEVERGGRRRVEVSGRDVVVTIPPGLRAGTKLRLRGRGRTEADGRHGDAFLVVEIADRSDGR